MFEQNEWLHQGWTKTIHNKNILNKSSYQNKTDSPTQKNILISHRFSRFSPPPKKRTAPTLLHPRFWFQKKTRKPEVRWMNLLNESPSTLDVSQILKKILPRLINFPPTEGSPLEFRDYLIEAIKINLPCRHTYELQSTHSFLYPNKNASQNLKGTGRICHSKLWQALVGDHNTTILRDFFLSHRIDAWEWQKKKSYVPRIIENWFSSIVVLILGSLSDTFRIMYIVCFL